MEGELGHASGVAGTLGLDDRHVVTDAVLGLAGGVALEECRATIDQCIEQSLVEFGGVGDRYLGDQRRAIPDGQTVSIWRSHRSSADEWSGHRRGQIPGCRSPSGRCRLGKGFQRTSCRGKHSGGRRVAVVEPGHDLGAGPVSNLKTDAHRADSFGARATVRP